jgi:hypothetical protein
MSEIISKISSYNIFNYLFPGIVFVNIAKATTNYNFIQENDILGVFLYYFIGLTISRFGSIIISPLIIKLKFLEYRDYKDFISASKNDNKIDLLLEGNNTYRTLISTMFLLLILKIYNFLSTKFIFDNSIEAVVLILLMLLLFVFSYRKQTLFLVKRIDINKI